MSNDRKMSANEAVRHAGRAVFGGVQDEHARTANTRLATMARFVTKDHLPV